MSFFGELVSSIGTDKIPPRPPQVQRPSTLSTTTNIKPVTKTVSSSNSSTAPKVNNLKRKADDTDGLIAERTPRPNSAPALVSKVNSRPSTPVTNGTKPGLAKPSNITLAPTSDTPAKAPPKGSYADIMARAKQAQEQRTQSKVGVIKHHATNKEKVSKLAERKRGEQEKAKALSEKVAQKPGSSDRVKGHRTSSPVKQEKAKLPKAPRPPLHAPAGYKGTMGTASKKPRNMGGSARQSRNDEYLGTDEEDDDEVEDYDGYDAYDSDESSIMEAGAHDVELEEAMALKKAKEEDARELAEENRLKKEKEERRKKLASMAAKRGR